MEYELKYLYHGSELPEGWEIAGSLEGTYHGQWASHIIRKKQEPERCPYCGAEKQEQQVHGHYTCMNCRTIIEGCCDGVAG